MSTDRTYIVEVRSWSAGQLYESSESADPDEAHAIAAAYRDRFPSDVVRVREIAPEGLRDA